MQESGNTCRLRDGEHVTEPNIIPSSTPSTTLGCPPTFVQAETLQWYPIRVTYSRELKVKAYLDSVGVETFLPMHHIEGKGIHAGRLRLVPVIHNLLFVRSTREELDTLKRNNSVAMNMRYIMDKAERCPIVIPEEQMRNFIAVSGTNDEQLIYLSNEEVSLKVGDHVRITGGAFKGVEGELLRIKGDRRLVVRLNGFIAVATAFIHPKFIEKI